MSVHFPESFPALETERMVLRELASVDAAAVFRIYANDEAMRYWSTPAWRDPAMVAGWIERAQHGFEARESMRWGVFLREGGALAGTCTLFDIDTQNRRAEVGYILDRELWGRGLMREALGAVLGYGFGELGLHRIEADIDPRNVASVRALDYFGFAHEGVLRERWRVGEEVSDSLMLGMLAHEWRRRG